MEWLSVVADVVENVGDRPFKILVALALLYGVKQLAKMRESMESLNTAIAVVVERTTNHEKRIESLERDRT